MAGLPSNFLKCSVPFVLTALTIGCGWYLVCGRDSFDYPSGKPWRCYSANHEYYITTRQTLWETIFRTYPYDYGTARLYDKTGKLLYQGKTTFGEGRGPRWFPNRVSMGTSDGGKFWEAPLPVPPGGKRMTENCYAVKEPD